MNKYLKKFYKLLLIPVFLGMVFGGITFFAPTAQAACGSGYSYCQTLTVDHTQVPSTQTNFTVLASSTQTSLKTVANGGKVNNTVAFNGQTVAADLIFSSTADCGTLMSWDFASYASTTGQIEAHILETSLSSSVDTTVTMCYGKPSVSTYQGGSVGAAWNSGYKGVWHFPNGTTLATTDSTSNANNASVNSGTVTAGQLDGAINYNGTSQSTTIPSSSTFDISTTTGLTLSAWVKASAVQDGQVINRNAPGGQIYEIRTNLDGDSKYYFTIVNSSNVLNKVKTTTSISTTLWQYVEGTWDGTTLWIYLNGSLEGTTVETGSGIQTNAGRLVGIGNDVTNGAPFFPGILDEVRFSAAVRSADWITAEYNNQKSASTFLTFGAEQSATVPTYTATNIANSATNIGNAFNGYFNGISLTVANASSTQSSFPVLVCFNGSSPCNTAKTVLKTVANGGKVQSTTGVDIIFTSDALGMNVLPYEQEKYASSTGESEYWVNLPSVTNGTVFYMFYGKVGATDMSNPTAVWNSNYAMIQHLANGSTLSALDSTSNAINGTINSATAATGQIDGAAGLTTSQNISEGTSLNSIVFGTSPFTISFWLNITGSTTTSMNIFGNANGADSRDVTYRDASGGFFPGSLTFEDGNAAINTSFAYSTKFNAWHYITWTFLGNLNSPYTHIVYLDGVQQATAGRQFNAGYSGTTYLGSNADGVLGYLTGSMDEVRVSTTVRTSDWIATEYNNQSSPSTFLTVGAEFNQGGAAINIGN